MRITDALHKSIAPPRSQGAADAGQDFGSTLMDALKEVDSIQRESREMQQAFMAGRQVDVHTVMIAMEKASIAMQLTLQVRNKLLEAYQEVSRMQV